MSAFDWIAQAAKFQSEHKGFALVTVLRAQAPTSAKAGDKALVTADGQIFGWIGGGCAQPAVLKTVRRSLMSGLAQTIRIAPTDQTAERTLGDVLEFGMVCHSGGTLELFIDPVNPQPNLIVIGDSPVAKSLVALGSSLGFRPHVIAHGAQADTFPDAVTVVNTDALDVVCDQLPEDAFVVVATQGRRDLQGLQAALALQPKKMWFVASARKADVLRQSLMAAGEDKAAVDSIISPAGQSIGAHTPEEIALSVIGSVVATRRGRLTDSSPVEARAVAAQDSTVSGAVKPTGSGSCCGGMAASMPSSSAEAVVLTTAKKSCCGE